MVQKTFIVSLFDVIGTLFDQLLLPHIFTYQILLLIVEQKQVNPVVYFDLNFKYGICFNLAL